MKRPRRFLKCELLDAAEAAVVKTLASGEKRVYYYAWRGGPRIKAKPGAKAFALEYARLTQHREDKTRPGTIGALADAYLQSPEFRSLAPSTRRDYQRAVVLIRARFEAFPTSALAARGARTIFFACASASSAWHIAAAIRAAKETGDD